MTGMTNYSADGWLEYITGKTSIPATPTAYVALFTAVGTDAGTGFTEVSGGSYARVATAGSDWNSASGTAPSTINNANQIQFPQATADWGTVIAFGIYDASTSGNLLAWDFLGNDPWYPYSATLASPSILTAIGITAGSSPTLVNGAKVVVTVEYGGSLSTGFTQYAIGTVASLSNDTFSIGVNASSTGSGQVRQITQQSIPNGVQAAFAASSLVISAA